MGSTPFWSWTSTLVVRCKYLILTNVGGPIQGPHLGESAGLHVWQRCCTGIPPSKFSKFWKLSKFSSPWMQEDLHKGCNTSHNSGVFRIRSWCVGSRQEGQSQLLTITHYSSSETQKRLVHYLCSETQKCLVLSILLSLHRRSLNTDNMRHTPTPSFMRIIPHLGGKQHFPTLSRFVCRFLNVFPTSCPVERLFWVASQVDAARRACLSPDTLTLLVFMHEALPLMRKIRADKMVGSVCG